MNQSVNTNLLSPAIDAVRAKAVEFNTYVDELRDELIDIAGNGNGEVDEEDYTISYGKRVPKGKKNKDVTTRILVTRPWRRIES